MPVGGVAGRGCRGSGDAVVTVGSGDGVDRLVERWLRWDRWPGHETTAAGKQDAIATAGLDARRLHDRVAELRRAGDGTETAVRRAVTEQAGA